MGCAGKAQLKVSPFKFGPARSISQVSPCRDASDNPAALPFQSLLKLPVVPPTSRLLTVFWPSDSALTSEEKIQIQVHRLLSVLGAILVPLFGILYTIASPGAFHPMGPRILITSLFLGLLVASYLWRRVRQYYVWWMRWILYVLIGWIVVLTAVNQFEANFTVGLLLTYAVLVLVVGLGARRFSTVVWFAGFGLVLSMAVAVFSSAFRTSPIIFFASMGTLALVESLTIQGWLLARREIQRHSSAIEASADGMAILDSDGTYVHVNQAHSEVYGYDSPEAFLGNSWTMCYDAEEQRRFETEVMPELFEEGFWRGEATGRRADGESFPQSLTLTALEDGGIVCVVRDITQQKKRERKLIEAKEEAEEAARMKDSFLANMSHEIRTPLTSVLGFAEVIREAAPEKQGTVSRYAAMIEKSGRRLMRTLDTLLHFSKLEAGEIDPSFEPVDLGEKAREVTSGFRQKAQEAGIEVVVEDNGPAYARADQGGVLIALRNLVNNAIKYTEEGGQVWVRTWEQEETVGIAVKDTGIGMDAEEVERLFEPFKQESEGIGREYEGTGLGLTLTRQVVEKMEGRVSVETEKGEGTKVLVHLPKDGGR